MKIIDKRFGGTPDPNAVQIVDKTDPRPIIPTGSVDITENGEYDVSAKATAKVNVGGEPFTVNNVAFTGVGTDGEPYEGGLGYKSGYGLKQNYVSILEQADELSAMTGYIPVSLNDIIRVINIGHSHSTTCTRGIVLYRADFTFIATPFPFNLYLSECVGFNNNVADAAYFRVSYSSAMADKLIVTINEKISPLEED